jgi:hypothetical protein
MTEEHLSVPADMICYFYLLSQLFVQEDLKMKRIAPFFLTILLAAWGGSARANAQTGCARDNLKGIMDKYFASLAEHNPSSLPLASTVKFTENGVEKAVGKGFWETAGKPLLKRTLIDTQKCGAHAQAVMEEPFSAKTVGPATTSGMGMPGAKTTPMPAEGTVRPILFGVRLRVENKKITEIETIIARENEFAFSMAGAAGVLETKAQDWETIVPAEQRTPRKIMIDAADNYFNMFAKEPKASVPFAKVCDRWENGFQTTKGGSMMGGPEMAAHDCSPKGLEILNHGPRRFLVDTETGVVVAYVHFASGLPDFHMFKMKNGKVDLIQAVIGAGYKSMGWPNEPAE